MAWVVLVIGELFEVARASLLDRTAGFTRLWPTAASLAAPAAACTRSRSRPGVVGAFLVGVLVMGDATSPAHALSVVALVASIAAVRLTAPL